MTDNFDDLDLTPLIKARLAALDEHPDAVIETSIAQLEQAAIAKMKPVHAGNPAGGTLPGKSKRRR